VFSKRYKGIPNSALSFNLLNEPPNPSIKPDGYMKHAGHIGLALWNFRGSMGILDSEREDVAYEDWYGHKLDRELLELLQRY
jgi:hypothetical protein